MSARLAIAVALVLGAALPATAEAASISYIGSDGNAYLTTPDGSRTVQLTKDATPTSRYRMAGQADDGQIVVHREKYFTWLNPDGTTASGPWRLAEPSSGGIVANAHVAPGGTLVAVDWNPGVTGSGWRVIKMPRGAHLDACAFGCVNGMVRPRWVPGAEVGFLTENLRVLAVQIPGLAAPQDWFTIQDWLISSFDVSRQGRILIEAFPDVGTSPPRSLAVLQGNGLPPGGGTPTLICELASFSTEGGFPRWSPDGSMIAWEAPAGVMVSPAPVNQGGTCSLSPRLIAAGGRSPDWGVRDVPSGSQPSPPPCTTCGPGPASPFDVKLKMNGRLPKLRAALARGLALSVETERPGHVAVTLVAGRRNVARGSRRATKAGTVKVRARFTRKAKRRYRRVRRLRLTARVTVTDSAGAKATARRKVVLKR